MRPLRLAVLVGAIASFAASGRLWFGALNSGAPELLPPSPEPQRVVLSPPPPVVVHAAAVPARIAAPRTRHRPAKRPSSAARGVATAAGPLISPAVYHPQTPSAPVVAAPSTAAPTQHSSKPTPGPTPAPPPKPKPKPVTTPPSPSRQPPPPAPVTVVVAAPSAEIAPPQSTPASATPSSAPPTETSSPPASSDSPSPPTDSSSPPPQQELDTRPGNGWGDDNHVHTGPPGQDGSHGNGNQGGHGH